MYYYIKKIIMIVVVMLILGNFSNTVNASEQKKVYTADHIKDEEARQVYQRVLDATSFMLEDSEDSKECLFVYGVDEGKGIFCKYYINAVNISEESLYAMPAYELFLEYVTYGNIQYRLLGSSNPFSTEQKLLSKLDTGELLVPDLILNWYREGTNKEPYEAFKELYIYQYKYLQENGCFYDFFRGADYFELQGMVQESSEKLQQEPSIVQESAANETDNGEDDNKNNDTSLTVSDNNSEEEAESLAPKNVFSDLIKNHIVSIIIIAILVVLLAYITIKNKRTNKKDID